MEQRFGPLADAALAREGIVTDDDSRWKLIEALARDLTEAAKKLARNANGDYSPDTYADRFPQLNEVRPFPKLPAPLLRWQRRGTHTPSPEECVYVMLSGGRPWCFGSKIGYDTTI
jgi:hypothetical protein